MDGQTSLVWREINKKIQEQLGSEQKAFVFRGVHAALFEICLGLHLRSSHKRKIMCEAGYGDHLRHTEIELAKLGVRLKSTFEESVEQDEKATLAYIHDIDDALTAERYDHTASLKRIEATKIPRVHIAHHLFAFDKKIPSSVLDYDILVCGLSENYALVIAGEKVTVPTFMTSQWAWDPVVDAEALIKLASETKKETQQEILAFESNLPSGVEPWFQDGKSKRLFDRAAIVLKGRDSFAMQELIYKEWSKPMPPAGSHVLVESASYCRWANEVWFEQAERNQRSREDIQGLLFIDGSILTPEFKAVFSRCLQKLNSF